MLEFRPEAMLELTKALMRIPSVSHAAGENEAARFIYDALKQETYFGEHPEHLLLLPCEEPAARPASGEAGGAQTMEEPRLSVLAYVPAGVPTARTVLLNGHFDVVDVDVYGELAPLAFDADACTARMAERRDLPEEVRADLESGNWLFGRGSMDMKAGLAIYMSWLAHMSRRRGELKVNLLFQAVPDEEGNSAGMRGSLPALCAFVREHGLDLIAALSGEPAFWTSSPQGRSERILFTGTTGKVMPLFFCVGREAHAGYAFDGVNAAALASQAVCLMDCHPELMDGQGADTLPPPVCLKLKDLRDSYSVTLPERAAAYFNVLTVSRSPRDILDICRRVGELALQQTLERIQRAGLEYQRLSGRAGSPVPAWRARVATMRELMLELGRLRLGREAAEDAALAAAQAELDGFAAELPADMDEREQGIAIADRLVSLVDLKGPAVVVGFLPPYYPQRLNRRATEKERRLRRIMEGVADDLDRQVGQVRLVECFSGIMDLSYMGFQGEADELRALADNMPGWGRVFSLPMDDLLSLDVPVASVGPSGRDAHKDTERLELDYSFRIAPGILERVVEELSQPEQAAQEEAGRRS